MRKKKKKMKKIGWRDDIRSVVGNDHARADDDSKRIDCFCQQTFLMRRVTSCEMHLSIGSHYSSL